MTLNFSRGLGSRRLLVFPDREILRLILKWCRWGVLLLLRKSHLQWTCMVIQNHSIWLWLDHGGKTACIRHRIMRWAKRSNRCPKSSMLSLVTQAIFLTRTRAIWVKVIQELRAKALIRRTSNKRRKDSEVLILSVIKEVSTKLDPIPKRDMAQPPLINFS